MQLILLDTSALFASLDADDRNHGAARAYLAAQSATYVVTDTVFSEAMTLIKRHLGVALAIRTGEALLAGAPVRLHRLSSEEARDTWKVFRQYADKAWSYTDCSLLAVARRMGIGEVLAFGRHFDQMATLGVRRVP